MNAKANEAIFKVYIGILLVVLLHSKSIAQEDSSGWQVKHSQKGITVLTRETPSGYDEVKASVNINASPLDFITLLEDVERAPQWIARCEKVELLKTLSETERIVKSTFSAPWPVRDREMITYSITTINPYNGSVRIEISDRSHLYPENRQKVRMLNVSGHWQLDILDNGLTSVTYQGYGEPSGNLPRWLSNQLVASSIYTTFANMRDLLQH